MILVDNIHTNRQINQQTQSKADIAAQLNESLLTGSISQTRLIALVEGARDHLYRWISRHWYTPSTHLNKLNQNDVLIFTALNFNH